MERLADAVCLVTGAPPQRVAGAGVRAIEDDCAEVVVPGWLGVATRARGASPGVYRALSTRFG